MATQRELEQKVAQLEQLLVQYGIVAAPDARAMRLEDRPDYIAFGSDKHLAFLGLLKVDDVEAAIQNRYTIFTSPDTGQTYRLIDEMNAALMMRPMDPDKAILMILRQKVSSFEAGEPQPFPGAPARFNPKGEPGFTPLT